MKGEIAMTEMTALLKDWIGETIRKMVDKPEEVSIEVSVSTKTIIVQIKVSQTDCGKIIGKRGRNIDALKDLSLAIKNTNFPDDPRRISLEVLEDETSGFTYKKQGGN